MLTLRIKVQKNQYLQPHFYLWKIMSFFCFFYFLSFSSPTWIRRRSNFYIGCLDWNSTNKLVYKKKSILLMFWLLSIVKLFWICYILLLLFKFSRQVSNMVFFIMVKTFKFNNLKSSTTRKQSLLLMVIGY